ncbi:hypothetical protein ACM46_12490 [Chryseobacterium angstadtii]|uniref:Serine protease n=1 Tax=Chryseobacterium angstadtii TaxID=558151 RepID=A0A0J7IG72_9FLAO|nr:serine protease [Chryseobacterium angstadtii]KMQ65009.1 hypothetical protein ACM46_12490 [Chryseobacterium angstadtii]
MKNKTFLLLFLLYSFVALAQPAQKTAERTKWTEESIKSNMSSRPFNPIEGIYKSYQRDGMPHYKIGIIKDGPVYKAIILETEVSGWKPGEVKAVFEPGATKGLYSTKWYMSDKTLYETFSNVDLESETILSIELKDTKTLQKRVDYFIKTYPVAGNDTIFKKDNSIASGSGFFLTTSGIIATNAHVVQGASDIEVTVNGQSGVSTYKAKLLTIDSPNDVALLKITDSQFKGVEAIPYSIIESQEIGSRVFTLGYPLNDIMGSNYKVTDGIISATSGIADDGRYYQISVPLQPGNSGGPLFNKDGNVAGITTAKLKAAGTKTENVNYALKSSYLLNLYKKVSKAEGILPSSRLSGKELQDQVKVLKNYVCLIKIY